MNGWYYEPSISHSYRTCYVTVYDVPFINGSACVRAPKHIELCTNIVVTNISFFFFFLFFASSQFVHPHVYQRSVVERGHPVSPAILAFHLLPQIEFSSPTPRRHYFVGFSILEFSRFPLQKNKNCVFPRIRNQHFRSNPDRSKKRSQQNAVPGPSVWLFLREYTTVTTFAVPLSLRNQKQRDTQFQRDSSIVAGTSVSGTLVSLS